MWPFKNKSTNKPSDQPELSSVKPVLPTKSDLPCDSSPNRFSDMIAQLIADTQQGSIKWEYSEYTTCFYTSYRGISLSLRRSGILSAETSGYVTVNLSDAVNSQTKQLVQIVSAQIYNQAEAEVIKKFRQNT